MLKSDLAVGPDCELALLEYFNIYSFQINTEQKFLVHECQCGDNLETSSQ